jgi:hypothetical protein
LGLEHPDVLIGRYNLATSYKNTGQNIEAAQLLSESLEVMIRILGPEHPDMLDTRNALADAYRMIGQDGKADALFEKD